MIYKKGTLSTLANSQQVAGTGTKWLKRVGPGTVLYISGSDKPYYIASVTADDALALTLPFGEGALTDVSYLITDDFTRAFHIPYPKGQDVEKANVLKRSVGRIDKLLGRFDLRVFKLEYPDVQVMNMISTPFISTVTMTTPTTGLITADSAAVLATSAVVTADGSSGAVPTILITADSAVTTADASNVTADGLYPSTGSVNYLVDTNSGEVLIDTDTGQPLINA